MPVRLAGGARASSHSHRQPPQRPDSAVWGRGGPAGAETAKRRGRIRRQAPLAHAAWSARRQRWPQAKRRPSPPPPPPPPAPHTGTRPLGRRHSAWSQRRAWAPRRAQSTARVRPVGLSLGWHDVLGWCNPCITVTNGQQTMKIQWLFFYPTGLFEYPCDRNMPGWGVSGSTRRSHYRGYNTHPPRSIRHHRRAQTSTHTCRGRPRGLGRRGSRGRGGRRRSPHPAAGAHAVDPADVDAESVSDGDVGGGGGRNGGAGPRGAAAAAATTAVRVVPSGWAATRVA